MADRRTTPRWLRPVAVLALVLLGCYHLAAFHYTMGRSGPPWMYFGGWKMFTEAGWRVSLVEGEVFYDDAWHAFEPTDLFPYEWESGPRYARSSFHRSPSRMTLLAASTCNRFPRDDIERVRYTQVAWRKRKGDASRPNKVKRTELIDWRCHSRTVKLPRGRTLE